MKLVLFVVIGVTLAACNQPSNVVYQGGSGSVNIHPVVKPVEHEKPPAGGNTGDHDKGHGNDPDHHDEDNPSKGKGKK